ncbi:hypothetical protein QJQ45_014702 [Haematococcus lacustris]|nr:hypothetical protein QJQ45_014702 [Haematococcus lacustris]
MVCYAAMLPDSYGAMVPDAMEQHGAGPLAMVCLVPADLQVFSWGGNQWGQLGLGHRSQMRSPQLVAGLWGQPVVQLCAGEDHSLALTATHHVFSWGRNQHGQLGLGVEEPAELTGPPPHFPLAAPEGCGSGGSRGTRVPSGGPDAGSGRTGSGCGSTPLPGLVCEVADVATPAATAGHMSGASCWELRLAQLDQDKLGQLLDMGILMDHAALALMQTGCTGVEAAAEWLFSLSEQSLAVALADHKQQQPLRAPDAGPGSGARSGEVEAAAATGSGAGTAPGGAESSRAELATEEECSATEEQGGEAVQSIVAGGHSSLALTLDGAVYAWGCNAHGALGLADLEDRWLPTRVQSLANVSIQAAAMGPGHCVLVAADGAVYGCGKCDQGQLPGVTGTSPVLTPVLLDTPFTLLAGASTDVSPGDSPTHSCPSHDSEGGEVNGLSTGDYSDLDETVAGASAATPCEDDHNAANPSLLSNAELDTAASTDGCLLDSDAAPARAHVCLHQLVCGVNCTCFVTRGPRDVSRQRQPDLRASLQAAVAAAQAAYIQRLRKHSRRGASLASALRTVASGVEQVMSCPSALVAAWRVRVGKRKGLDLLALDEVLQAIFALTAATTTPARVNDPAMEVVTRPDLYPAGELSPAHSSSCTTECSEPQGTSSTCTNTSAAAAPGPATPAGSARLAELCARAGGEAGCGLGGQEVSNGEQVAEVDRVQQNRLAQVLLRAFSSLVDELGAHTELLVDADRAQLLLAALHCPLLMQHAAAKQLLPRLCFSIIHAPESGQQLLVQSWAAYPGPLLSERMVQPLQSYLTKELTATKKLTTSIMAVIRVLALIEEANQIGRQLPPEAFYNQLISDKMDVADHYTAWRHSQPVASHAPRPRAASPLRHNAPASRAEELRRARRHTTADSDAGSSALPPRSRGLSPGRQRHAAVHIAVNVGRDTATTSRATTARSEPSVRPFQTLVERAPQPHFDPTRPFSFCSFPFLLDARAKSNLLHIEARFQMEQTVAHARMEQQLYGAAARNALNMRLQGGRVMPKSQSARHDLPGSAGPSQLQPRHSAGSQGSAQESSEAEKRRSPGPHGLRGLMSALQQGTSRLLRGVTASGAAEDRGHARELPPPEPFSLPAPAECSVPGSHSDMCILRVRRTHLAEDALEEIGRQASTLQTHPPGPGSLCSQTLDPTATSSSSSSSSSSGAAAAAAAAAAALGLDAALALGPTGHVTRRDLYKPLRVHFIGEDGIDAGGVKKEFFQILVAELLNPDYGLLQVQESNTFWFCPSALETPDRYLLLGLVLGLAVYNRVLLDFALPLVAYKKLLGQPVDLRDLEDMQPTVGRSLRQLLAFEGPGSVEDTFCLSWVVSEEAWGVRREVELVPGGADIPVTEGNREQYVAALVDYHLNSSVAWQYEAFSHGFRMLCDGPVLKLLRPQELERLVCGNPHLDFEALQRNAKYEAGYTATTPVIVWLWEMVQHELPLDEQKRFLKFFTGTDRSPIGGLGTLRCLIQRDGPDSTKLPTSHTCFNTLLLPEYSSRPKLARQLRTAVNNAEGFGLDICDGFTLLFSMAKKKRRTVPRLVPEDPDSDIEDRDEALQPDLTEAQRNKKVSGEARAARDRDNTYHGRKCKIAHLIDHLPQELWDAFLDDAVQPRVEAISERAVLANLLFGLLVRGLFTIHVADPLGLHDQPVYTDIPVSQAAIPDLSCRNLFLQLVRGLPGNGANTRPNAAVAAVLAAHPDLRARLAAIPRHPSDANMVDHVGKQLETAFSNMLTVNSSSQPKGVPVSQMLKEAVRQFPAGRVVMVDEFRTSRVSSAYSHPSEALPGQPPESFRWLQPVYSKAKRSRVRGLMCSTSNNIRFYDRDVSAALNIRRCAVGPGPRPTELCYWDGRPAMPKPGRPGQEWVYLRDKALLRKWRRKWRR